ncbi:MAG: hypothetical protein JXR91_08960 [Deltaproteobacteria bacterium]|nr:hypothetical protein [Deltaproteobacteria bacterium]
MCKFKFMAVLLMFSLDGCKSAGQSTVPDNSDVAQADSEHSKNSVSKNTTVSPEGLPKDSNKDFNSETPEESEELFCDAVPAPADLVADNCYTTDISAVVKIVKVEVVGENGGPPSKTGYVNHKYTVELLDTLKGNPEKELIYFEMADADSSTHSIGDRMLVSLCKSDSSANNQYYSPDNGYTFTVTDQCVARAKQLCTKTPAQKLNSACE